MNELNTAKNRYLHRVLLLKWVITLFAWGLPALVGPPALFALLGVPFPDDPTFVRLFGAVVTAAALVYWYAWKDPVGNIAIIRYGILDNALVTATILILALSGRTLSWFFWVSAALTAFFCVSFIVTMPQPKQE